MQQHRKLLSVSGRQHSMTCTKCSDRTVAASPQYTYDCVRLRERCHAYLRLCRATSPATCAAFAFGICLPQTQERRSGLPFGRGRCLRAPQCCATDGRSTGKQKGSTGLRRWQRFGVERAKHEIALTQRTSCGTVPLDRPSTVTVTRWPVPPLHGTPSSSPCWTTLSGRLLHAVAQR